MRVLLINLPWNENGRRGVRAGSRWPFTSEPEKDGRTHYLPFPFFLAYATSLLKSHHHQAKLVDAVVEGIDEKLTMEVTSAFQPELIVIETSTPSFDNDIRIAGNIKRALPVAAIAFCGPHATVFCREILETHECIDFVLLGEFEESLLALASRMQKRASLSGIPALAYRRNKTISVNFRRKSMTNLDALPWPERNDVPLYSYNDGFAGLPQPNVQMLSSRGCPLICSFCTWPQIMYPKGAYCVRKPSSIVDEMEFLIRTYGFKAVYFDDDTFNIDKGHVLALCHEIKKRSVTTPWAIMARADRFDRETLEKLASSGLFAVKYGIESANKGILRSCGKITNIDRATEMVRLTKKLGIKIHLTFCIGLPGETQQTLEQTFKYLEDVQPDSYQISFATPFPGTKYYEFVRRRGWLFAHQWSDYDGNTKCIVQTGALTPQDLERMKMKAFLRAGLPEHLNAKT